MRDNQKHLVRIIQNNDFKSLVTECKNIANINAANIQIDIYGGSKGIDKYRIPEDGLTLLHVAAYY